MPTRNDSGSSGIVSLVRAKRVYAFDWDGTLFDSMVAKGRTFARAVSSVLARRGRIVSPATVERLYRRYSGRPRPEIFAVVAQSVRVTLSSDDLRDMSDELFALNRDALVEASLFADGRNLLDAVLARGLSAFISSSVPQEELDHFVGLKLPASVRDHLAGVFGSYPGFGKGPGHLGAIMRACSCPPSDILVVGDDVADDELSRTADVDCIVVDRTGRLAGHARATVSSLDEIARWLTHPLSAP